MRVAIFSDVHGNLTALEAVLDHIARQPNFDHVIFAGDAAMMGPRPAACAARIRESVDLSVYGNTDEWLFRPLPFEENEDNRERMAYLHRTAAWTRDQLGEKETAWLQNLPFSQRISPTGRETDDLLIVHANPLDTMQVIYPPEETQREMKGEVTQPDAALAPLLAGVTAAVIAYGHLHIPSLRPYRNTLLANISSVSLPGDNDPRAKYGLLVWDGDKWHASHERVAYNREEEIAAFRQFQPPDWETTVSQLAKAA